MCDGTNHKIVEIFRAGYEDNINKVAKLCSDCGGIVVDGEYDGRAHPGYFMKMRFPEMMLNRKININNEVEKAQPSEELLLLINKSSPEVQAIFKKVMDQR